MSTSASSLPAARLTAISQALAALTKTSLSASAIAARAFGPKRLSPLHHQSSALVSRRSCTRGSIEGFRESLGKLLESRLDRDPTGEHPRLPRRRSRLVADDLRHRLTVVLDDDLTPGLGLAHELRERRLGFVDADN